MCTYLKGQTNKDKRQRIDPTKLLTISIVELKIKQENEDYVFLKAPFDSSASAMLVSQAALDIWKRPLQKVWCLKMQQVFFYHGKCWVKMKFPEI